jgi:drug/metabolite transporter (DMT)-like permease
VKQKQAKNHSQEPYTPQEMTVSLIAFVGILCIARPAFLFGHSDPSGISGDGVNDDSLLFSVVETHGLTRSSAASFERTFAVVLSVVGAFSASVAYATIRLIGDRAHSLVSVNYFAILSTVVSAFIILVHPDLQFVLPRGAAQW